MGYVNFQGLTPRFVVFIALLAAAGPVSAAEPELKKVEGAQITEETVWGGSYLVTGVVTVAAGARLKIEAGSKIYFRGEGARLVVLGDIRADGQKDRPILFAPAQDSPAEEKWGGIAVQNTSEKAKFSFCTIKAASTALALVRASAIVADCVFERNRVGLDVSMESKAEISRSVFRSNEVGLEARLQTFIKVTECSFEENTKFGIALSNGAGGEIRENVFRKNGGVLIRQGTNIFLGDNKFYDCRFGIIADQVKHDVRISGNRFEGGEAGIQCLNFSSPWVACGEFRGLDTAVIVNKFSNPMLKNNLFAGNKRAVFANQKSNFPIKNNVFWENDQAIFIDLSSYPVVEGNNFIDNRKDIVLGIYMSADWEKRVGSGKISLQQARGRGSRNLGGVQQPRKFKGEVDARHNWWGEVTTAEMERLGAEGNVGAIEDYFDKNEVEYPNFGEGKFRLDKVVYQPWEKAEVQGAGPLPGGCGDLPPPEKGGGGVHPLSEKGRGGGLEE